MLMFARDDLIQEAQSLDPLPASSARLSQVFAKEDWALDEVAKIAALDEALTGRLLRAANSTSSGSQASITSVGNAVMRLGPSVVMSVSLGAGLKAQMSGEEELWLHSVSTALCTEVMRKAGLNVPPGTFIAALVHDVGKLVIRRKLKSLGITLTPANPDEPWIDEAEQLEIDHAELGASIAQSWKLPDGVPQAVHFHHLPHLVENPTVKQMAEIVAAADEVAHSLDRDQTFYSATIASRLGVRPNDQERIQAATRKVVGQVMQVYG